jgi:hypothetical protein
MDDPHGYQRATALRLSLVGVARRGRRRSWPLPGARVGIVAVLVVIVGAAACDTGARQDFRTPAAAPVSPSEPGYELSSPEGGPVVAPPNPVRTVEESGGLKLASISRASCTVEGPADWAMQAPDRSDRADVFSPDGSMYAGYGIQAVNTALYDFAYAYDPPMNDPNLYSNDPATVAAAYGQIVVGALGGAPDLAYAGDPIEPTPGYLLMPLVGSTHQGVIFYRTSGFPGDGVNYSYALPMYFAFTTSDQWEQLGPLVARVAASIRCRTQFQPPDDYPVMEVAAAGEAGDENGDDAGYNPQLGTEQVNDPTTGENYLVDPSVNWSETGPDGPGYYVQKGMNDYQRLEPGRVD